MGKEVLPAATERKDPVLRKTIVEPIVCNLANLDTRHFALKVRVKSIGLCSKAGEFKALNNKIRIGGAPCAFTILLSDQGHAASRAQARDCLVEETLSNIPTCERHGYSTPDDALGRLSRVIDKDLSRITSLKD